MEQVALINNTNMGKMAEVESNFLLALKEIEEKEVEHQEKFRIGLMMNSQQYTATLYYAADYQNCQADSMYISALHSDCSCIHFFL